MEEANFLTKYASRVYVVHRRDTLRASKVMQRRAEANPKIEFLWDSAVAEASGDDAGFLAAILVKNLKTGDVHKVDVGGLFFAIGHEPATAFLDGQLKLDSEKYIETTAGSTATSVQGVFAAGDVQDKKWRQAITAAGTGALRLAFPAPLCSPFHCAHACSPQTRVETRAHGAGCMAALEVEHFLAAAEC